MPINTSLPHVTDSTGEPIKKLKKADADKVSRGTQIDLELKKLKKEQDQIKKELTEAYGNDVVLVVPDGAQVQLIKTVRETVTIDDHVAIWEELGEVDFKAAVKAETIYKVIDSDALKTAAKDNERIADSINVSEKQGTTVKFKSLMME